MVVFSFLGALLNVLKFALSWLPNIELVSVLIIVYTCIFGWYALIPVYIFAGLEILLYGLNTWTINYLYVWSILVIVAIIFKSNKSPVFWAVVAGIYGVMFGALCSFTDIYLFGFEVALSKWISGLPFDFVHCAGNFATTLFLYKPIYNLIKQQKDKLNL